MRRILAGEEMLGRKILAGTPSFIARIGDGHAVVAARRRDDAGLRNLAREQIGEGAARLERAGMLLELQLQAKRMA